MNPHVRSVMLGVCLVLLAPPALAGEAGLGGPGTVADRIYVALSPEAEAGPSAVTWFDLEADGRPRRGSTCATGGLSRSFFSPQGMALHPRGDLLFVANNASDDLTVFRILRDGTLMRAADPYPVGGIPVYLAVHPSGDYLYVGNVSLGLVRVFRIDASGGLTVVQDVSAGLPVEMEVGPRGDLLFVAAFSGIRVYHIAGDGTLAELSGSSFPTPAPGSRTLHLELDATGGRVFALDLDAGIAVYDVGPSGALGLVDGSPFFVSSFANTLELSADDRFAYAGSPFEATLDVFRVLGQGKLAEVSGSPFDADFVNVELVNPPGTGRLYQVGVETRRISVFSIGPAGRLTEAPFSPVGVDDAAGRVPNGAVFGRRPRR